MAQKPSVILGISGGVDSSVCAYLLKSQGYDVHAVFMNNWHEPDNPHCPARQDLKDAKAVCDQLNIPLSTVDFSKQYWDRVFDYFLKEYSAGRTPNPDILCNQEIKFKAFLNHALQMGCDWIAMGHYAQTQKTEDGSFQLLKGMDSSKDQSYFLYTLGQKPLQHSLFPLGKMKKNEVRAIAKRENLINHAKKDSTGICFIGERKFNLFLSEYLLAKPGNIVKLGGEVIGKHDGLMFYTLGQRQGLGVGGQKEGNQKPWYVADKNVETNELIVVQGNEHPKLYNRKLICSDLHWVSGKPPRDKLRCSAKVRYRQIEQCCTITPIDSGHFEVAFESPQWAVTPGQSVVFYNNDVCLGGAVIQTRSE